MFDTKDKQKLAFRKWYSNHKEAFNSKRKKRYAEDPEYHDRMLNSVRRGRVEGRRRGSLLTREREINGVSVVVVSRTQIAEMNSVSSAYLVKLEKKGILPPSSFPGEQKMYTLKQVDLIVFLLGVLETGGNLDIAVGYVAGMWDDEWKRGQRIL
jgi:hypothetical protein